MCKWVFHDILTVMEPLEPMHVHSGACHVKWGVAVWVAVFDLG